MKIKLLLLIGIFSIFEINAQSPRAYLNYCKFYELNTGSYLETYLTFIGNSLKFVENENHKFGAKVEITMLFKQNDSIKYVNKYSLSSPEINDTLSSFPNFIDLQRIALKNGTYQFELNIIDLNNKTFPQSYSENITIDIDTTAFYFSDIELLESYKKAENNSVLTKNGFDLIPYVSNFYPNNIDNFSFYFEMYNLDKLSNIETEYLLNYYLEKKVEKEILNEYSTFKKVKALPINVTLSEFNIEKLPSAEYNLVVELKTKENKIVKSMKYNFVRSNIEYDEKKFDYLSKSEEVSFVDYYKDVDTLKKILNYIYPIADGYEGVFINNQLKLLEIEPMKNFFYNFWKKRNENSPYSAWQDYYKRVLAVNKEYSFLNKKGYETDRGRTYLKYGSPSSIVEEKYDERLFPYEVWTYNEINGKSNRKFIFYNPQLVNDDYFLIHSTMDGELYNENWKSVISRRNNPYYNQDERLRDDRNDNNHYDDVFRKQ